MPISPPPADDNILGWAIGVLCTVIVSMAGAFAVVLKNRKVASTSVDALAGEVPESRWILNITNIVRDEIGTLRQELKEWHIQGMAELKENFQEIHKARNTLLVLNSKLDEAEKNIIEAVQNGKH